MRLHWPAALILAALARGLHAEDGCPEGTVNVATHQPLAPFHCVEKGQIREDGPYMQMRKSFRGAGCPQGTRAVPTGGPLKFRCVMDRGQPEADVSSAKQAPPQARAEAPAAASLVGYAPYKTGSLRVDLPRGWHITDAWKDEVPTLYVEYDARRPGKQMTLWVSKISPGQPGFDSMESAIAKEKEYHSAIEGAARRVGGLPARQTLVAGESRTAYADAGGGAYYVFAYSAPQELFKKFEPAYERLLTSFHAGGER